MTTTTIPQFNDVFTKPEYSVFKVVFFPDRVYHHKYLSGAARSTRYRYNIMEAHNKLDITVLKGEIFLDGEFLCNFLRIEYRASRLAEVAREKDRVLQGELLAWIKLLPDHPQDATEAT